MGSLKQRNRIKLETTVNSAYVKIILLSCEMFSDFFVSKKHPEIKKRHVLMNV